MLKANVLSKYLRWIFGKYFEGDRNEQIFEIVFGQIFWRRLYRFYIWNKFWANMLKAIVLSKYLRWILGKYFEGDRNEQIFGIVFGQIFWRRSYRANIWDRFWANILKAILLSSLGGRRSLTGAVKPRPCLLQTPPSSLHFKPFFHLISETRSVGALHAPTFLWATWLCPLRPSYFITNHHPFINMRMRFCSFF